MSGPGGREVGRVNVRVLPNTADFLGDLEKFIERVERQISVDIPTNLDVKTLAADIPKVKAAIEKAVPKASVPLSPDLQDGFLARAQADVKKTLAAIEANVPLTADGERLRRDARVKVAELQAQLDVLNVSVPLDPELAAGARVRLLEDIAKLKLWAKGNEITIPVTAGSSGLGGSSGGGGLMGLLTNPAVLATGFGLVGSVIAALPALVASIAAPLGTVVVGLDGIKKAAADGSQQFKVLKNGATGIDQPFRRVQSTMPSLIQQFQTMQKAVSGSFAKSLTPAFQSLGAALPKLTPAIQSIATALGGAFSTVIEQLTSPKGLAMLSSILDDVATAITTLSPVLAPMTSLFLSLAQTGMQTFVAAAPALLTALTQMTSLFQTLNDSGVIQLAVEGFAGLVIGITYVVGAVSALAVAFAGAGGFLARLGASVGLLGSAFQSVAIKIGSAINTVIGWLGRLPASAAAMASRVAGFVGSMAGRVAGFFASMASRAAASVVSMAGRVAGAVASMASRLVSSVSSAASRAVSAMASGMGRLVSAVSSGVGRAVSAAAALPGKIAGAIGGAAGRLYSVGVDMIQGLINGIGSMASAVAQKAASVVSGAISAAKRALHIGSPSRVFMELGEFTGQGFVIGMDSTNNDVASAGKRLARASIPDLTSGSAGRVGASAVYNFNGPMGANVDEVAREIERRRKLQEQLWPRYN